MTQKAQAMEETWITTSVKNNKKFSLNTFVKKIKIK